MLAGVLAGLSRLGLALRRRKASFKSRSEPAWGERICDLMCLTYEQVVNATTWRVRSRGRLCDCSREVIMAS